MARTIPALLEDSSKSGMIQRRLALKQRALGMDAHCAEKPSDLAD
jgi:hypothetical protein